jgi:hypothetical protein
MPWLRTQTEFEMEDEDVVLSSESFATVSDPCNGQPGAAIPEHFDALLHESRVEMQPSPWNGAFASQLLFNDWSGETAFRGHRFCPSQIRSHR